MRTNVDMKVSDHSEALDYIDEISDSYDITKTDYGYEGVLETNVEKDELVSGFEEAGVRVLLTATINQQGKADGIAYELSENGLEQTRKSFSNDPQHWHGLVYDGLRVTAKEL